MLGAAAASAEEREKMKAKFKAGDRVRVKVFEERPFTWNCDGKMDHMMGKVYEIKTTDNTSYSIYDEKHDREWTFDEKHLEPVNECIVIYRNGSETIALDKCTGKKAVAKCSPDDTYDFYTGAQLAFERLTGTEKKEQEPVLKPTYFNGYVECVSNEYAGSKTVRDFTIGKVYKVVDGRIKSDSGHKGLQKKSVEEICKAYGNTFKELKKVKRLAQVGDCVLIDNACAASGYSNFDIVLIENVSEAAGCIKRYVKGENLSTGKPTGRIIDTEYVVLEGYEPAKKLYNGKVVCVEAKPNIGLYTAGKIYQFKDGLITADNGKEYPTCKQVYDFADWENWTTSKFIEVVE